MASQFYNLGMRRLIGGAAGAIDWVAATNIKVMLLTATTPYTPDKDHQFVSSVVASEAAGTGYVGGFAGAGRKLLSSKTITDDLVNDRVLFNAGNPATWTALSLTSGAIAYAVVFAEVTSDAASPLIALLDPVDLITNGGDVSLVFPSGVVGYIQN